MLDPEPLLPTSLAATSLGASDRWPPWDWRDGHSLEGQTLEGSMVATTICTPGKCLGRRYSQGSLGAQVTGPWHVMRARPCTLEMEPQIPAVCPRENCLTSLNSYFLGHKMETIVEAPSRGLNRGLGKSGTLPSGGGGAGGGTEPSWASALLCRQPPASPKPS